MDILFGSVHGDFAFIFKMFLVLLCLVKRSSKSVLHLHVDDGVRDTDQTFVVLDIDIENNPLDGLERLGLDIPSRLL